MSREIPLPHREGLGEGRTINRPSPSPNLSPQRRGIGYARPPAWFRYGLVAAATLIMCSCRAPEGALVEQTAPPALSDSLAADAIADKNVRSVAHTKYNDKEVHETVAKKIATAPAEQEAVVNAIYETEIDRPEKRDVQFTSRETELTKVEPAQCQVCPPATMAPCVCAPEMCGIGPPDEYLCDGGDYGLPVGVRANWQIDGLEQEDTVAHYDTVDGRTIITPSNRVCIYAPRFGVVRKVVDLHEYARYEMPDGVDSGLALSQINEDEPALVALNQRGPNINRARRAASLLKERQMPGELALDVEVREFSGALAPYANLSIVRAGIIEMSEKALVQESVEAAVTWTGDQAAQVTINKRTAQAEVGVQHLGVIYHQVQPNNPKLRLIKLASKCAAQPGDEVEFILRFDNIGDRVIGNVTIVDNLTTRLEYIPDTAEASVDAEFSTSANEHGSLILRWEITEPVEPGEGGILRFKCRVL